jgi:hypothetical protein
MLTQEYLQQNFIYCEDGLLARKKTGKVVTCNPTKHHRYLRIGIDGKPQALHRMIFLYHHGYLPKVTDHIDGNRLNNRIENLRACTQSENCLNSKHRVTSTSPYKNVYLAKHSKNNPKYNPDWKENWVVSITVDRNRKYIGSFENVELADLVATEARDLYHGQYARHS